MTWQLPHRAADIRFRALDTADLVDFLAYRGDPRVARYQGWSPLNKQEALAFLARESNFTELVPGAWSQLGLAAPQTDRLIGDVGLWLSEDASTVEFGISLCRAVQGRGLGTQAVAALMALIFASTAVEAIVANTDRRNEPCRRALLRAGMDQIGERTETYKGETCTEHCFRLERSN